MRYFASFPKDKECPLCGTNDDKECFLMPIDGTGNDNLVECTPTHRECAGDTLAPILRHNIERHVVYARYR